MDRVQVNVTNDGLVAGADVVQVFMQPPKPASHGDPIKTLFGFERVFLQPQESVILQVEIFFNLRYTTKEKQLVILPGS